MHRNKQLINPRLLSRLTAATFAVVFLAVMAGSAYFGSGHAGAIPAPSTAQAVWLNSSEIKVTTDGVDSGAQSFVFTDSNPNDDRREFAYNEGNGCTSILAIVTGGLGGANTSGSLVNSTPKPNEGQGKCEITLGLPIFLLSPENAAKAKSTSTSAKAPYGCNGEAGPLTGSYVCPNGGAVINGKYTKGATASDVEAATAAANAPKEEPIPCEGGIPGLGWLICLVAKGADAFVVNLETSINSLLSVPPESYGEGASAANNGDVNGLKTAWSAVRIIASLLLVGVALFMVLSQIFSFDFVSAYTVKKVLPKLVIATILIQLSWLLFTGFIQVVDTISLGLRDLLFAPFGGKDQVTITQILSDFYSKNGATGAQASVAGISAIASTAGIAAIGGGFGLLAAAIGVLLAVLTAFVTLVIRKVIIIVLLVLAPLALVAWILPNTQKLWSTWWQLFSKLTLMFPLIVLLLASGKIFAYLTAQQNTGGWLAFYIIIVAYFGPLFLIPATFKFAGGLFGKIGSTLDGAANKYRGGQTGIMGRVNAGKKNNIQGREYNRKQRGIERTQSGNRFNRARGRFAAGTAGASGAFANQLRASEEQEAVKNAGLEYNTATKGMEFNDKVASSLAIAKAKSGETVQLSNGNKVRVTEGMQRTSAKFLADTGRSDQLRVLEDSLKSTGRGQLWNTINDENAGAISKINPDQQGKEFHDLSSDQMASMKPGSFRNMKAKMADLDTRARSGDASAKAEGQAIIARLQELRSNPTTSAAVGGEALEHIDSMLNGNFGPTVNANGDQIDYAGRAARIDDGAGNMVVNPEFGRSAGAKAGAAGSTGNPNPRFY